MMSVTGLLRACAVLAVLTACDQKTISNSSSSGKPEFSGEVQLSGNGSGYNGKLHYVDAAACTKVDVDVNDGTPVAAELSRENCADITPRPLIIGSEVQISADLRSMTLEDQPLNLVEGPGPLSVAYCKGVSNSSGRMVSIQFFAKSTGLYMASVMVEDENLEEAYVGQFLTAWSGVHFGLAEHTNDSYLNVSYPQGTFTFVLPLSLRDNGVNPIQIYESGTCQ